MMNIVTVYKQASCLLAAGVQILMYTCKLHAKYCSSDYEILNQEILAKAKDSAFKKICT